MLVFTRKYDEAVMIGDAIEIRVLRVGRDTVRLGVEAPAAIPVHRREVYEQIRDQNRSAAATAPPPPGLAERLGRAAHGSCSGDAVRRRCSTG